MRGCVQLAALGYKTSGIVALIGSHCHPLLGRDLFDHQQRRISFRRAIGLQQLGICDQPVAVLDEQISAVTQLCFFASAFAGQLRVRVGVGFVSVIGSLFAVAVSVSVAVLLLHCLTMLLLMMMLMM